MKLLISITLALALSMIHIHAQEGKPTTPLRNGDKTEEDVKSEWLGICIGIVILVAGGIAIYAIAKNADCDDEVTICPTCGRIVPKGTTTCPRCFETIPTNSPPPTVSVAANGTINEDWWRYKVFVESSENGTNWTELLSLGAYNTPNLGLEVIQVADEAEAQQWLSTNYGARVVSQTKLNPSTARFFRLTERPVFE